MDSIINEYDIVPRLSYESVNRYVNYITTVQEVQTNSSIKDFFTRETSRRIGQVYDQFATEAFDISPETLIPGGVVRHIFTSKHNGKSRTRCYVVPNKSFGTLTVQLSTLTDHTPMMYERIIDKVIKEFQSGN